MNAPDIHPHADSLAEFLVAAFGLRAERHLAALQVLLGNRDVMDFLEAFGFVHESTLTTEPKLRDAREGMRMLVLHVHAARSVTADQLEALINSTGASP
jgi:hypothetical protein